MQFSSIISAAFFALVAHSAAIPGENQPADTGILSPKPERNWGIQNTDDILANMENGADDVSKQHGYPVPEGQSESGFADSPPVYQPYNGESSSGGASGEQNTKKGGLKRTGAIYRKHGGSGYVPKSIREANSKTATAANVQPTSGANGKFTNGESTNGESTSGASGEQNTKKGGLKRTGAIYRKHGGSGYVPKSIREANSKTATAANGEYTPEVSSP